jgi:hypothetical protein
VYDVFGLYQELELAMMAGSFREYNWDDILRLVMADSGLKTEQEQRTRGETWIVGGSLRPPEHPKDTCIRVQVYDKPFGERITEHAGEK